MTDPYWAHTFVCYYLFKKKGEGGKEIFVGTTFCGNNIFIEGMFGTQLSSNAGTSV